MSRPACVFFAIVCTMPTRLRARRTLFLSYKRLVIQDLRLNNKQALVRNDYLKLSLYCCKFKKR